MSHGLANTQTLYDASGNPVSVQLDGLGRYTLSVSPDDSADIAQLLREIILELKEIRERL